MAAISAAQSEPVIVISPARPQATSSHPAHRRYRADSADVMKIPEPIIDPTTIIAASIVPSSRTRNDSVRVGRSEVGGHESVFRSVIVFQLNGERSNVERSPWSTSFCQERSHIGMPGQAAGQSVNAESSAQASLLTR